MKINFRAKHALWTAFVQLISYAQVVAQVSGTILSNDHKPLESIPVSLLLAADSNAVTVTLSERDGSFLFANLKPAQYLISVSTLGYKPYQSDAFDVTDTSGKPIHLAPVLMQIASIELNQVSVTGKKDFIQYEIDRTVINVDALISNAGANVLEVLEKSPGVMLDQNGNISLKGQSGVLVMVDNRPTYLSAAALIAYLKSLPSSTVDKIELITNPPARYDAAGSAGIINIKTKKTNVRGLSGSITVSAGRSSLNKHNENTNLNYRRNRLNLFTNASFNSSDSWRKLDITRTYFGEAGAQTSSFNQTTLFYPKSRTSNLKAGMDFYVNASTTLGFVFNGSFSGSRENRPVHSSILNSAGAIDSLILADNRQKNRFNQNGFNFNFFHQFDSVGHMVSVDADFVKYNILTNQTFSNKFLRADNSLSRQEDVSTSLPSYIDIFTVRSDYEKVLKNKGKFGAGFKSSYVATDNAANYFLHNQTEVLIDYEKTNRFRYNENINAAYVNFNKDFPRFSVQLGLRAENTNIVGHQLGNAFKADSAFQRHYTSLFPTAFLSYKLDSNNTKLNFSYGRRIGRPYYQDLNPFIFLLDKFSYFAGNPFLQPEFGNRFTVAVNYRNRFNLSFLYNYTTNMQGEVIEQKNNIFISRTGNISRLIWGGITLTANLKLGNWYTCNLYMEVIRNNFRGMPGNATRTTGSTYGYISPNNQFIFKNGWSAELSGFYITKSQSAQFDKSALFVMNVSVQKKILAGKGVVKLTLRDVLSSLEPYGTIGNIPNATATYHNDADTRVLNATFTYSFSRGASAKGKRNTGGSGSEEGRVKL